jgi:hypothetical protein
MNAQSGFPSFDAEFKELNQFLLTLADDYNNGQLKSWDALDEKVKAFHTPERMNYIEAKAPGWKKMASYSDGITLTHVTCVFLGMFMLPEFKTLSSEQQQLAKWIALFHDIDKFHIRGKKDSMHAFRSGVVAANTMQKIGFPVTNEYDAPIRSWSEFTVNAFTVKSRNSAPNPGRHRRQTHFFRGLGLYPRRGRTPCQCGSGSAQEKPRFGRDFEKLAQLLR